VIPLKAFYFVRHGHSEYNLDLNSESLSAPLTQIGREQALQAEKIVRSLPIQSICSSPLQRAIETRALLAKNLSSPQHEIFGLAECSGLVWQEMISLEPGAASKPNPDVQLFIEQVASGLTQALSLPGPVLLVAHGGVYWAICRMLKVEPCLLDHCVVVHFKPASGRFWQVSEHLTFEGLGEGEI
jgi:probable phosphoglycerate mutase